MNIMNPCDDDDVPCLSMLSMVEMDLTDDEETWLCPEFRRHEGDGAGAMRLQSQQPTSRRHTRFKTQVIKCDDLLGGAPGEELDLEAPPSLSSLEDFGPSSELVTTDTPLSAFKSRMRDRINAIHAKYATAPVESANTPDSDLDDLPSPVIELSANDYLKQLKAKLVIESPDTDNVVENKKETELALNRTFELSVNDRCKSADLLINATNMVNESADLVNGTFQISPVVPPRKLSLSGQTLETDAKLPQLRMLNDLCSSNKLSALNNNLFVASKPIASKETSQSMSNINDTVQVKPSLKKQGTFEILDDIEDKVSTPELAEENPYQTMVLESRRSAGYDQEFIPYLSTSSTPSGKTMSRTLTLLNQERVMNTSFTIAGAENCNGDSNGLNGDNADAELNRSFTVNREQTIEHHMAQLNNSINDSPNLNQIVLPLNLSQSTLSNNSFSSSKHTALNNLSNNSPTSSNRKNNLNQSHNGSFNKLSEVNKEFFSKLGDNVTTRDIRSNGRDMYRNEDDALEDGYINDMTSNGHRTNVRDIYRNEDNEYENGLENNFPSHNLNESFIITRADDLNSSDINGNDLGKEEDRNTMVNGKVIRSKAVDSTNTYRTFTRPKKPAAGGSYSNGIPGGVQRKFLMGNMKQANGNATYIADHHLNETVNLESTSVKRPTNRFSTITRPSSRSTAPGLNETVTNTSNRQAHGNLTSGTAKNSQHPSRFSTITRPKSKLQPGRGPQNSLSQLNPTQQYTSRLKNSSSSESLKSNESYVISGPGGARCSIQNRNHIYKSTGALNFNSTPKSKEYTQVLSTENLSVKSSGGSSVKSSAGSDSGESVNGNGGLQYGRSVGGRIHSGLLKPGFSRIPAPASSRPSMLQRFNPAKRV